jgi:hypothetical protein
MTHGFLTPLNLQDIDGERFQLLTPLVYQDVNRRTWSVEPGFVTDFASIPRPQWWRYPKSGPWNRATVLHDWLYAKGGVTRARADGLFLNALQACGVSWRVRHLFYRAVRIGAAGVWRRYRDADSSGGAAGSRPVHDV